MEFKEYMDATPWNEKEDGGGVPRTVEAFIFQTHFD
jgi:hypothetical protein